MTLPYDILGDALEAIGFQDFELRRFTGNSTDVSGRLVPSYSDEKTQCVGSIQPADYGTMEQLGFNVAKKAFNIWTETEIHTVRTHGGADLPKTNIHAYFWNGGGASTAVILCQPFIPCQSDMSSAWYTSPPIMSRSAPP